MIFVGVPPADLYPVLKAETAQHEESWKTALQSMIKVNEDFKIRGNDVLPKKGRDNQWRSLHQLLQGDKNSRLRIQYYKTIATTWMPGNGINVLAMCTQDEPLLPTRLKDSQFTLRSKIESYLVAKQVVTRPAFPGPPQGFVWNDGRAQNKKRKSTDDPLNVAHTDQNTVASGAEDTQQKTSNLKRKPRSKNRKDLCSPLLRMAKTSNWKSLSGAIGT